MKILRSIVLHGFDEVTSPEYCSGVTRLPAGLNAEGSFQGRTVKFAIYLSEK